MTKALISISWLGPLLLWRLVAGSVWVFAIVGFRVPLSAAAEPLPAGFRPEEVFGHLIRPSPDHRSG
jgi:hypothetical protein